MVAVQIGAQQVGVVGAGVAGKHVAARGLADAATHVQTLETTHHALNAANTTARKLVLVLFNSPFY